MDSVFLNRMFEHIYFEEQENTTELQQLPEAQSNPLVKKLLDHSYFLQKMLKDTSIPVDIKQELLDHFMEEHVEWQAQYYPNQNPADLHPVPGAKVQAAHPGKAQAPAAQIITHGQGHGQQNHGKHLAAQNKETNSKNVDSQTSPAGWTVGPMWK
jgi:hypothetical protein